jgi:hypothetical protein
MYFAISAASVIFEPRSEEYSGGNKLSISTKNQRTIILQPREHRDKPSGPTTANRDRRKWLASLVPTRRCPAIGICEGLITLDGNPVASIAS